jgi:hypothetical protein
MIARPKISRNERKTTEIGAFEVGNFAPLSCPGRFHGQIPGLRLVVLTSPSKTYNVAGLDLALAVIPDDALRRRYFRAGRDQAEVPARAGKESDIPNFKGSDLGRFPLVSADL